MRKLTSFVRYNFSIALAVTVLCCGNLRADDGERYPAADCEAQNMTFVSPCHNKTLSPVDSWCLGKIDGLEVVNDGVESVVFVAKLAKNCTNNCGVPETTQPFPITSTVDLKWTYTDSTSLSTGGSGTVTVGASTTGGVGTPVTWAETSLWGEISATLYAEAGTENGYQTSVGSIETVPLPPCGWAVLYSAIKVVKGKKVKCTGSLSQGGKFECTHTPPPDQVFPAIYNPASSITETLTVNQMAVFGVSQGGTDSNGICPEDEIPFVVLYH